MYLFESLHSYHSVGSGGDGGYVFKSIGILFLYLQSGEQLCTVLVDPAGTTTAVHATPHCARIYGRSTRRYHGTIAQQYYDSKYSFIASNPVVYMPLNLQVNLRAYLIFHTTYTIFTHMVTDIETMGLVLGAFPIVIDSTSAMQERLKRSPVAEMSCVSSCKISKPIPSISLRDATLSKLKLVNCLTAGSRYYLRTYALIRYRASRLCMKV